MTVFQDRLQGIMDERKVKAVDLSKATGLTPGAISRYLSDPKKEPSGPGLLAIAKALNVNPEWLYGATDTRKPFDEPPILDIYEKLSDAAKKEVINYAKYLLEKESSEG